ncbi:MAG: DUF433 domain-containing protein [bacterium]|nr:DUF433 domain-containing protein [bacterium]
MSRILYEHIDLGNDDVPKIKGTRTKVVQIVLDKLAYGWSPEEIHFQHPHLSMGQIYSALAYYADHQEELDAEVEKGLQEMDITRERLGPSLLVKRLKKKGLL